MTKNILLNKWVNSSYLDVVHQKRLAKSYSEAILFPHIILKDIFVPERMLSLKKAVGCESFHRSDSDLFSFSQTDNLLLSKNIVIREFITLLLSDEFSNLVNNICGINILKNKLDCSGFLYTKKDYLLCHDDRLDNRAIAYILYLNNDFKKSDGGGLCLHRLEGAGSNKVPGHVKKTIIPMQNSLVLFSVSEVSFHSVQEVVSSKNRLTLTGWYYRK